MRGPCLAACLLGFTASSALFGEALLITTTPSHTATPSPTPTATPSPTPTLTPTSVLTVVPTAMPTPWAIQGAAFPAPAATPGTQSAPAVGSGPGGGFVVVWTDSAGGNLAGRRFDAAGTPIDGDFIVNNLTSDDPHSPAIASDSDGDFVVVWTADDGNGGLDVRARQFGGNGPAFGPEFTVNTSTAGNQGQPDVAMDNAGEFVVVWASDNPPGIVGRRYDPNGNPLGGEFAIPTSATAGERHHPAVTISPSGSFIVVWTGPGEASLDEAVFGRGFDFAENPIGDEFPVGSSTLGSRTSPDVAWIGSTPGFVATFERDLGSGSSPDIAGRVFRADTAPMGDEFRVDSHEGTVKRRPRVSAPRDTGGPLFASFVVVWESLGQDAPSEPSGSGLFAQRFSNAPFPTAAFFLASPPRKGSEYQINPVAEGEQGGAAVATDFRGQFVIAWEAPSGETGQTVLARRFGYPDARPMLVDTVASGGTSNVNGVLEPGEQVVVAPAWANPAFGVAIERGTADNMVGPAGATYAIDDGEADYGSIGTWDSKSCLQVAGDCYQMSISSTRPIQHWDATFDETLIGSGPLLGAGDPSTRIKTWALHVGGSFGDVPADAFYPFIENIFHNRVTAGGGCGSGNFCGDEPVLRQQMAVFLLRSVYGSGFVPPAATGTVFDDVPAASPFAPWIEELAREGITSGCAAPPPPAMPSFCPTGSVTRQQISAFLLKTRLGAGYVPPPCVGIFEDVPCGPGFPAFIEDLYSRGITGGCQADPLLYCPTEVTKRKQMAAFLVRTFSLALYSPD